MRDGQALQLPALSVSCREEPAQIILSPTPYGGIGPLDGLELDWLQGEGHLEKLITLSCHTRGIRSMLLSVFYEYAIECNSVTPWLQGALVAIDSLAREKPLVLGRMFMDRSQKSHSSGPVLRFWECRRSSYRMSDLD